MLLYAVEEDFVPPVFLPKPEFLQFKDVKMQLKHQCREVIIKHLIDLDPHSHLFGRISQLPLPSALKSYMLYNVSLEVDESDVCGEVS